MGSTLEDELALYYSMKQTNEEYQLKVLVADLEVEEKTNWLDLIIFTEKRNSDIVLTREEYKYVLVEHHSMPSAYDIMQNLKEMLGDQNPTARHTAMKELMNTNMEEGTPVRDHVLKMIGLLNELEILEVEIDGKAQAKRLKEVENGSETTGSSSSSTWAIGWSEKAQGQMFSLQAARALESTMSSLSCQIEQPRGSSKPSS
ncbi:uncharacterized protein LOC131143841 [Malania oleifera]|uniref:uncharacterized protein LOC131143841 n=1 Tax=Malania oleifera TaxID=397392 RepID=UPI0025AE57C2|nr:uncharacterized protein LOC131143841 [Malania oleifera]